MLGFWHLHDELVMPPCPRSTVERPNKSRRGGGWFHSGGESEQPQGRLLADKFHFLNAQVL